MPEVSIIVPVYKVPEQYLRKCIESCINQTLKDIEVILVDDGSPDQCGQICDGYAKQDQRIKVIHKNNGGLSAARNTGFEHASGQWIMFVDGDDWIESDMCEGMLRVGERTETQLVMCGIVRDYGHSHDVYKFYLEDGKVYRGEECKWLQEQLLHYNGNIAVAYSKLIDRKFLMDRHIEHDPVLKQGAEGLEFNLRMFEELDSAVFINKPYYHYTYNAQSISSLSTDANNHFILECFKKIKAFIATSRNRNRLIVWFDNRLLYVIISTAISGYFNSANKDSYMVRKEKFEKYLEQDIVKKALHTKNLQDLSKQRMVVLFLIKHHMFWALDLLGRIRKKQKTTR
jgi:glycosyltransferase involved in cell wall biosynthesis